MDKVLFDVTELATTMKVDGTELNIRLDRMHSSWLARVMEYGARRLVNDTHSAEKGQTKIDLCIMMIGEMESGRPMAEKVRKASVSKADPVRKMARDLATDELVKLFKGKAATFGKDEKAWALHPAIAKYFKVTEKGSVSFQMGEVDAYMTRAIDRKENPRDFMAESATALAQSDQLASDVDMDDLGL